MAFIIENNNVISFAEFSDVVDRDQRLFDANESLTDDVIETLLIRSTERILSKLRSTTWWVNYYYKRNTSLVIDTKADIPKLDPNRIIERTSDFTDLCVYTALSEFILPMVADFGNEDNAERQKMGYYTSKTESLFMELVSAGDWYDYNDDLSISSSEKEPGVINLRRVR